MKKRHVLFIQGNDHQWAFEIMADPRHVADWRADGLTVNMVENTVPAWIVDLGLLRPWCFLQDLFYFRNPFK